MNLFELYAKISLDDSGYKKGVKDAKKESGKLVKYIENASKGAEKMEKAFSNIGKAVAIGFGVVTTVATGVTTALLSVEGATEEYRIAQGKLNTAFEVAGYNAGIAKGVYNDFYRILGDTDTAAEASQLLAKLADSQEDLSTWTTIATGIVGTFGDALPIESLIESANETIKVGQVTGTLADALNWAGISEDELNKKLEACSTEAERNNLVMETLSGTYTDAAKTFEKNNEKLMDSRETQLKLKESFSKVGEEVSRLKSEFLERFAPAIEETTEKVSEFLSKLDAEEIIDKVRESVKKAHEWFLKWAPVIATVTGVIGGLYGALKTMEIINTVTTAVKNAGSILSMFGGPVGIAVAAITGLVAWFVTAYQTNDEFREKVDKMVTDVSRWLKDLYKGFEDSMSKITGFVKDAYNAVLDFLGLDGKKVSVTSNITTNRTENVTTNRTVPRNYLFNDPDSSNAGGLDYVPFDGYIAELHRGEKVLTAQEAHRERSGANRTVSPVFNVTVNGAKYDDIREMARDLMQEMQSEYERGAWAFA